MKEINVNEIDRVVDPIIIDVREDYELEETGTIKGAIHIPMNEVPNRLNDIPVSYTHLWWREGGV